MTIGRYLRWVDAAGQDFRPVSLIGRALLNDRSLNKGKLRYRCEPDLYLRPGDAVTINGDSFTVDNITMSISPIRQVMEVTEA